MDVRSEKANPAKHRTTVERPSDLELRVTRTIDGPPRIVFEAWTNPELFKRWWVPKSLGITLLSCEMDVRTGGTYRLVFAHAGGEMAFHGKYTEVIPPSRIVWTNEEAEGVSVTTVTFEAIGGKTRLVVHELHPSKEARDGSSFTGGGDDTFEAFDQLDELIASTAA